VIDGEDHNVRIPAPIYDAIDPEDDLPQIRRLEFRDDAPRLRVVPQAFDALEDAIHNHIRVPESIASNEVSDAGNTLQCLGSPA
jgi:hypothetical protein